MSLVLDSPTARRRRKPVIPGFGLALGYSVAYLSLIVLVPLAALVLKSTEIGVSGFVRLLADERVRAALWLSFAGAAYATLANAILGPIVAWVLTRYDFPGKRFVDAAVDLPFALPTAVAGIALAAIYAPNGWIGSLVAPLGIRIAFTPVGVGVALAFVGLPFVVRTLQPVVENLTKDVEEVSATLGAGRLRTLTHVVAPELLPALLSGVALAFARAVGEYGSVIFIAGNLPRVSEIAPLLIVIRLEEFDYAGATAIAVIMLAISFIVLAVINGCEALLKRRLHDE